MTDYLLKATRRAGGRWAASEGRVQRTRSKVQGSRFCLFSLLLLLPLLANATVPPPEKLLPDDTLIMVTVPDYAKASAIFRQLPQSQLWSDPAMKPFKDKFLAKWHESMVGPLERELNINFSSYTGLLQGQVTFAMIQNGWQGSGDPQPGWLLLIDAKDKSSQLKTNLVEIRKKCTDAGKSIRTEKIRDVEFMVLSTTSNDLPKTLRKFMPKSNEAQDSSDDSQAAAPSTHYELVLGQVDSLLIVGNSLKVAEKIVARCTGGTLPALADSAAYQANLGVFRDAPTYAWVNTKAFIDIWTHKSDKVDSSDSAGPVAVNPAKIAGATGLAGLRTIAASFRISNDGQLFQVLLGVPEATRVGIFKLLAGEPKELNPPPFVPADAVKFQRWRIDGQKAWATIEKVLGDISPQWVSGVNFLLQTANTAGQEKDPGFDVRKNLIGNLGDDIITYEKAPPAGGAGAGPSLVLIASPNAEQLASALKNILIFFGQQPGTSPDQREFLGRKIYSVPLGGMPFSFSAPSSSAGPVTLNYAASGGYLAFSTDVSLLEEYLRSSEKQGKALRETRGLLEAAQWVTGPGASLLGYENDVETMKTALDSLRTASDGSTNAAPGLVSGTAGVGAASQALKDWFDFSLLPPFERISKYFSFSVYGGSANTDGLAVKVFMPTSPALRAATAAK